MGYSLGRPKLKAGSRKTATIKKYRNKPPRLRLDKPARASDYQSLPERIRWLRANMNPYMTEEQLALRAAMTPETVSMIENADPTTLNLELNTLRKIAHALDCRVFINIRRKPSKIGEECQPLGHTLPPLPEWSGKATEIGRKLAAKFGSYPWKNQRRLRCRAQHRRISYIDDKPGSEQIGEPAE